MQPLQYTIEKKYIKLLIDEWLNESVAVNLTNLSCAGLNAQQFNPNLSCSETSFQNKSDIKTIVDKHKTDYGYDSIDEYEKKCIDDIRRYLEYKKSKLNNIYEECQSYIDSIDKKILELSN